MGSRVLLVIQLVATLLILALVPHNASKLLLLLGVWTLTFFPLKTAELVLFAVASVFFTFMNALALDRGIFRFTNPDVLGMPAYETCMWGFYLLHAWRMLKGPVPVQHLGGTAAFAVCFSLPFVLIADQQFLLLTTGALLAAGLILYHDRWDVAYVGYMVVLGALIEYTGVWSGEWTYPGNPPLGVPLWFISMWGGIGLLLRRLVLPLVNRLLPKA